MPSKSTSAALLKKWAESTFLREHHAAVLREDKRRLTAKTKRSLESPESQAKRRASNAASHRAKRAALSPIQAEQRRVVENKTRRLYRRAGVGVGWAIQANGRVTCEEIDLRLLDVRNSQEPVWNQRSEDCVARYKREIEGRIVVAKKHADRMAKVKDDRFEDLTDWFIEKTW